MSREETVYFCFGRHVVIGGLKPFANQVHEPDIQVASRFSDPMKRMDYFLGIGAEILGVEMIYATCPNMERIVQLQTFQTSSDFRPSRTALVRAPPAKKSRVAACR